MIAVLTDDKKINAQFKIFMPNLFFQVNLLI